ncbi:MAG: response regulator [Chloroflexia bacterium]
MERVAPGGEVLVLIAEDEPDNREIMRAVVEDMLGYKVVAASDGATAVRLALEVRPSVILMDLMMPVLDGFEAIRQLKSNTATASISVIAITALGRTTDRQRAFDLGAEGYVSKPFDLDVLAATVQRFVLGAEVLSDEGAG